MPLAIELARTTFSAGEVSPPLRVRSDLAKAQTGLWFLENMIVLLEGGVTRRPGTQMVVQLPSNQAYVMIPFRFSGSGSNAYLIVIGDGAAGFILGNAVVVVSPTDNTPYIVAVPYTDADLGGVGAAVPGVSNLRWAISGNVVFLFCDGHPPATLTRNADNSWSYANYIKPPPAPIAQGGAIAPVGNPNLDPAQTLAISSTINVITLTGSANFAGPAATVPGGFQPGHIGTVWRLDESTLGLIAEWAADAAVTVSTSQLTSGNFIGGMANPANAFGTAASAIGATQTAASGYVGVQLPTPSTVDSATLQIGVAAGTVPMSVWLYASNVAPANARDGVLLASGNFNAVTAPGTTVNLAANDQLTNYAYVWITWTTTSPAVQTIVFWADILGLLPDTSPTCYRYNGNVYQALNPGNSGSNPPVHSSGTVLSGAGGVYWLYRTRGYGFVLINAVNSPTQATGTVLEQLPDSIAVQPTANWWPSGWDGVQGWPSRGKVIRGALLTGRQGRFWLTQPGTFNNYDIFDPTSSQSAIAAQLISPSGALAWIEAFIGGLYIGALTRDEEWVLVGQDILSPITVENLSPYVSGQEGSAVHVPAEGEGGLMTINRARDRALFMELAYSYFMPQFAIEELTLSARHILGAEGGGALGVSWQQDPNRVAWYWCANGLLVGNTLMRKQQINGWHRHPQHAPSASVVQGVATIPSTDESQSLTYLQTQRTIGAVPGKFIELLQPYFQPQNSAAPTAAGAFFVDCGSSYSFKGGVTEISGLGYLAGQEVAINADGCEYRNADGSRVTVPATGTIQLDRTTFSGVIGLPIKYRARLLPLDMTLGGKSTIGARQKANHLILYLVNSAGGTVAVNPDQAPDVPPERLDHYMADVGGGRSFGDPVPLFTGPLRVGAIEAPLADQTIVEIAGDDTMPFTLAGVVPDVVIEETD